MSYNELLRHRSLAVKMMVESKQEPVVHAFWMVVYRWVCEQIEMTAASTAITSNPR
jgi:hypothetical protein